MCLVVPIILWFSLVQIFSVESYDVTLCKKNPVNMKPNTTTINIQRWSFASRYSNQVPCTFNNKGTHLEMKLDMKGDVSGGGLGGEYTLSHGVWYWGDTWHRVQGVKNALEVQLVLYNTKYKSYKAAQYASDGVAVLSTLYKLSSTDNPDLAPIIDNLQLVATAGSNTTFMMGANTFLPVIKSPLYRYSGILPFTPSCTDVTWTVFYHTRTVSENQISKLKSSVRIDMAEYMTEQVDTKTVMVGAAWLETTTGTTRDNRDTLQLAVKSETETVWYREPAPVWGLILGMVVVLVGGVVMVMFLVKKMLSTHNVVVATDDIEMD